MTIIKDIAMRGALALLAVLALALTFGIVTKADAQPPLFPTAAAQVAEDEPGWNCWTDGNETCGDTLAYVEATDAHGRGAILSVANDGIVYVAWQDGTVTPAVEWQRKAAWDTCVDYADGTDASLQDCDAGFQNPGDRFSR